VTFAHRRRFGGAIVVVAIGLIALTGSSHAPAPPREVGPLAVTTFAVLGDSISAGQSPSLPDDVDPTTWISYAQSRTVRWVGGWTRGGSTTSDLLEHLTPVGADVLVVLGGTNNVNKGLAFATAERDLIAIGAGCACGSLLVVAIPPNEMHPLVAAVYNQQLLELARQHGWSYVDPWVAERHGVRWRDGRSIDGVHPVIEVFAGVGRQIRAAILEAAGA